MQLGSRLKKQHWSFQKPKKPKADKVKYQHTVLGTASNRAQYFTNYGREEDGYDEENDHEEEMTSSESRTSISLKEVNDLIKKQGLKEKDIYFTAAFDEDYLVLEVVHVHKMSEQEKLDEYQRELSEWEAQEKIQQEYEEQRIQRDLANLQRRAEELKKKKS